MILKYIPRWFLRHSHGQRDRFRSNVLQNSALCARPSCATETLEPRRLLAASLSGVAFDDLNANGMRDPAESGVAGETMYLDANNNGVLDPGESSVITGAEGIYSFTVDPLRATRYVVARAPQTGRVQTSPIGGVHRSPLGSVSPSADVNVSELAGAHEAETAVAINPSNTLSVVEAWVQKSPGSNIGTVKAKWTTDDGASWQASTIEGISDFNHTADPSLAWDEFGNVFLAYLGQSSSRSYIKLAVSIDGGRNFKPVPTFAQAETAPDQPTVAVAAGSVWVSYAASGIVAQGAPVTGLIAFPAPGSIENIGTFVRREVTSTGTPNFADIAVGPSGDIVVAVQDSSITIDGQQSNVDVYRIASPLTSTISNRVFRRSTNVSGQDVIPPQSVNTVDASPSIAWDRGRGRVYLVYSDEPVQESNDTQVIMAHSTDNGLTWTDGQGGRPAPKRIDDEPILLNGAGQPLPGKAQFLPDVAVDQTTGHVAVGWHDARMDDGGLGEGNTNQIAGDDTQFWATVSTDGGLSFAPNFRVSDGTSNAGLAAGGGGHDFQYGDYLGLDFHGGAFRAAWGDNSRTAVWGPGLKPFDVRSAKVVVIPAQQPGRYSVVVGPNLPNASNLDFGSIASSQVTDAKIFYNDSKFDGYTPGPQAPLSGPDNDDEDAIPPATEPNPDPDPSTSNAKYALRPGQTATAANYTSFDKGINGLVIDLLRLGGGPAKSITLASLSDYFTFQVGNTSDAVVWGGAPAPTSVTVRPVTTTSGGTADRVTLIWANGAIKNTWLRTTVLANDRTGLTSPEVFYYGNLVGESYYNAVTGYFVINALDSSATQQKVGQSATIANLYDHNRDGSVTSVDVAISNGNINTKLIALLAP